MEFLETEKRLKDIEEDIESGKELDPQDAAWLHSERLWGIGTGIEIGRFIKPLTIYKIAKILDGGENA